MQKLLQKLQAKLYVYSVKLLLNAGSIINAGFFLAIQSCQSTSHTLLPGAFIRSFTGTIKA